MLIGEKIQAACAEKGKTVKWLINEIGMTETGYYQSLRNESIKLSTINNIAKALQKPTAYFFSSTVEKITVADKKANIHLELDSDDVLKIDLKNRRLEILKKP